MSCRVLYVATSDVYCRYITVPGALYQTFGELIRTKSNRIQFIGSNAMKVSHNFLSCQLSSIAWIRISVLAQFPFFERSISLDQFSAILARCLNSLHQVQRILSKTGCMQASTIVGFVIWQVRPITNSTWMWVQGYWPRDYQSRLSVFRCRANCFVHVGKFWLSSTPSKAYSKAELYSTLRTILEGKEKCKLFLEKWKKFQPHFACILDADEKL